MSEMKFREKNRLWNFNFERDSFLVYRLCEGVFWKILSNIHGFKFEEKEKKKEKKTIEFDLHTRIWRIKLER